MRMRIDVGGPEHKVDLSTIIRTPHTSNSTVSSGMMVGGVIVVVVVVAIVVDDKRQSPTLFSSVSPVFAFVGGGLGDAGADDSDRQSGSLPTDEKRTSSMCVRLGAANSGLPRGPTEG
jgi:hypothetical protein